MALGQVASSLAATLSAVGIVSVSGTALFTFALTARTSPVGAPYAVVDMSPPPQAEVSMPMPIAFLALSDSPIMALNL